METKKLKRNPIQTTLTKADKEALHQLSDLIWRIPCHLLDCKNCPFGKRIYEEADPIFCSLRDLDDIVDTVMTQWDIHR